MLTLLNRIVADHRAFSSGVAVRNLACFFMLVSFLGRSLLLFNWDLLRRMNVEKFCSGRVRRFFFLRQGSCVVYWWEMAGTGTRERDCECLTRVLFRWPTWTTLGTETAEEIKTQTFGYTAPCLHRPNPGSAQCLTDPLGVIWQG